MATNLTDELCTRCGLCCDGTLLADVELSGPAEVARVELLGLELDETEDRPVLVLPCAALSGTRCGVYAHRPRCCRTFECRLLQNARRGAVTVESARGVIANTLHRIGRVEALLALLGQRDTGLPLKERVAAALAAESGGALARRMRRELANEMAALESAIRNHFLAGRWREGPGG